VCGVCSILIRTAHALSLQGFVWHGSRTADAPLISTECGCFTPSPGKLVTAASSITSSSLIQNIQAGRQSPEMSIAWLETMLKEGPLVRLNPIFIDVFHLNLLSSPVPSVRFLCTRMTRRKSILHDTTNLSILFTARSLSKCANFSEKVVRDLVRIKRVVGVQPPV